MLNQSRKRDVDRTNPLPTDHHLACRPAVWHPQPEDWSAMGNRGNPGRTCARAIALRTFVAWAQRPDLSDERVAYAANPGRYRSRAVHVLFRGKAGHAPDVATEPQGHCHLLTCDPISA